MEGALAAFPSGRLAGLTLRLRESRRERRSSSVSHGKEGLNAARLSPSRNCAVSGRGLGGLPVKLPERVILESFHVEVATWLGNAYWLLLGERGISRELDDDDDDLGNDVVELDLLEKGI